jgi:hypothetical protein
VGDVVASDSKELRPQVVSNGTASILGHTTKETSATASFASTLGSRRTQQARTASKMRGEDHIQAAIPRQR